MIDFELEYSYITNGKALALLHIQWGDPQTLYHHVVVPSEDVGEEHKLAHHSLTINSAQSHQAETRQGET